MQRSRIEQLARLLPANALVFQTGRSTPRLAQRLNIAVSDPSFLSKLILTFVLSHEQLPLEVHESWIRRAHCHYAGDNAVEDRLMLHVEQLAESPTRHVLQALLISRDAEYEQISQWLSISVEVIKHYEQLHFNVRDRLNDKSYIAQVVYPNGRIPLYKTDAACEQPVDLQLIQAGYQFGYREVLWLSGLTPNSDPPSIERGWEYFEQALIQNAKQMVVLGHQNAKSAPGIDHAKHLLARRQEQASAPTDQGSVFQLNPGEAIHYTLAGTTQDKEWLDKFEQKFREMEANERKHD